jgi:predicted small lipoprotein YifL
MKKITSILLSSTLALTLIGCGAETPKPEEADFRCRIDGSLAPEWTCGNSMIADTITSVGSAPLSKLGQNFSRTEAMSNGRSNLALQIETLVKTKVEQFARSTGVGAAEVADKVSTQVSKNVAKVTLQGSKQMKFWQNPANQDIYVLVGLPEGNVNAAVKDQVKTSFKNDEALWQQFQSKNALESLEAEFPTN